MKTGVIQVSPTTVARLESLRLHRNDAKISDVVDYLARQAIIRAGESLRRSRGKARAAEADFLAQAKLLNDSDDEDAAIDYIFNEVDERMLEGDFDSCDRILNAANPNDFTTVNVLAFLTITLCAREKLPSREGYFNRALEVLQTRGNEDAVREWTAGLE